MINIVNATQHVATQEQKEARVWDLEPEIHEVLQNLLTFSSLEETLDVTDRVEKIVSLLNATGALIICEGVMIGGAPYLMGPLTDALKAIGSNPVFAYSNRVSTEDPVTGIKTSTFKHLGFVQG
jgi:hypothetical protein